MRTDPATKQQQEKQRQQLSQNKFNSDLGTGLASPKNMTTARQTNTQQTKQSKHEATTQRTTKQRNANDKPTTTTTNGQKKQMLI